MIELDAYEPIYYQNGQQVELQNNIGFMVVNQIVDGPVGKRCPNCNAVPMKRTSIVWAESTQRAGHGIVVLNRLALRVAPPRQPRPPDPRFPIESHLKLIGAMPALFVLVCCAGALTNTADTGVVTALLWLPILGFVAALIWTVRSYLKFREGLAAEQWQMGQSIARYNRDQDRWRRSWFCGACGTVAVEEPSPTATPTG
ncbi:hypothetical protein [Micromonospora sp. U21]|uniref:hypothetical protein n=1 Tax=Micromonospora sp. U21 TaxID=2824899 RepID=UPI001B398571|nr:hypothetical protein [Micromonospora sp. U21]MBQ0906978.1 hypothetical protein [Micromonospora sp. U21]